MKAPGEYVINFGNIQVNGQLQSLTGEISATLQVPLIQGPVNLNFPYSIIPAQGVLKSQCDQQSGIVQKGGRNYCRYCQLCWTSQQVEQGLNSGYNKYLPELENGQEQAFAPQCNQISPNGYQFKRTVQLPSKSQLQQEAQRKYGNSIDSQIKQRLDQGKGKFQIYLNLISSSQDPLAIGQWFSNDADCRCCAQGASGLDCLVQRFTCPAKNCFDRYTAQCVQGQASNSACYTVEFNYRVTDKMAEVNQFLASQGLQASASGSASVSASSGGGAAAASGDYKAECVAAFPAWHPGKRYCQSRWSENYCCRGCQGVCPSG